MKLIKRLITILLKSTLALALTFLLFILLPLIYTLLGSDLLNRDSRNRRSNILMKVEVKKPEEKKIRKVKPRKIKSHRKSDRSSSSSKFKFSPDLSIGSGEGIEVGESNLENVIFEEGEADVSAVPISRTPVPFPRRAKEAGIDGVVELILLIDRKGNIAKIDFVKVPHTMFKKPILKVVKTWKFKPAMNKGVPVKMRVKQIFEFNLED